MLYKKLSEKEEQYTELNMEAAYMWRTLRTQQRLLDKIPQDVMDEIKRTKGSREIAR